MGNGSGDGLLVKLGLHVRIHDGAMDEDEVIALFQQIIDSGLVLINQGRSLHRREPQTNSFFEYTDENLNKLAMGMTYPVTVEECKILDQIFEARRERRHRLLPPRTRENGFRLCSRCNGCGCLPFSPAGTAMPYGSLICDECGGLGWFENTPPITVMWRNIPGPKVMVAWTVLFVAKLSHAWLGWAIREMENWVAS